jgi:hypothetical protein
MTLHTGACQNGDHTSASCAGKLGLDAKIAGMLTHVSKLSGIHVDQALYVLNSCLRDLQCLHLTLACGVVLAGMTSSLKSSQQLTCCYQGWSVQLASSSSSSSREAQMQLQAVPDKAQHLLLLQCRRCEGERWCECLRAFH